MTPKNQKQNYYEVLGLSKDAEKAVIRAAYRALVAIYHPDRNTDQLAAEKIRLINAAYEVLYDDKKRGEYDKHIFSHEQKASKLDGKEAFSDNTPEDAWLIAVGFNENIELEAKDLEKISTSLSYEFKREILQTRRFSSAKKISNKLKSRYLSRRFGNNKEIQEYAEQMIRAGEIDAALYLHKILTVMGDKLYLSIAKEKLEENFSGLNKRLLVRKTYAELLRYRTYHYAALLIQLHGGTIKQRLFSSQINITLDSEAISFIDTWELCRFLEKRFSVYS